MPRRSVSIFPVPTWVYHLRCDHGGLLYVGMTNDLKMRIKEHRRTKSWWPEVASVEAHQFPTRREARTAELDAIRIGSPLYNMADVEPYDQFQAMEWKQNHRVWELPHRVIWYREPSREAR